MKLQEHCGYAGWLDHSINRPGYGGLRKVWSYFKQLSFLGRRVRLVGITGKILRETK